MFFCAARHSAVTTLGNESKSSCRRLNKRTFEDSVNGFLANHRKVLDKKKENITTNPKFRTKKHCVATYEQIMKSIFIILNELWKQMECLLFHCKFNFYRYEVIVQNHTLIFFQDFIHFSHRALPALSIN